MNAGRLAAAAIALTALVVGIVWLLGNNGPVPRPTAVPSAIANGASPAATSAPTPAPTPAPTATVSCTPEPAPLPSMLAGEACPGAILAVELAVAPVRLPIERIVIGPGPFYCNVIWPGVGSPTTCFGFMVRPGQYMHAWVSFNGSPKVAAVMLGLDLPADDNAPGATRPPWNTTVVRVEIPPAGWVMP